MPNKDKIELKGQPQSIEAEQAVLCICSARPAHPGRVQGWHEEGTR